MITRIGILQKLDDISNEAFRNHWRGLHSTIAAQIPGIIKYNQNHIVSTTQLEIDYPKSKHVIDGISQIWFEDLETMQKGFSSEIIDIILEDEKFFIGKLNVLSVNQNVVIPVETHVSLVKIMILFKRRSDLTFEAFQSEWYEKYNGYFEKLPNIKGYNQYRIIDSVKRQDQTLQIDGILELWFEDKKSFDEAFSSEMGQETLQIVKTAIDEMHIFLVETHEIVK